MKTKLTPSTSSFILLVLLLKSLSHTCFGGKPSVANAELQFVPVKYGEEIVLPCQSDEDNVNFAWYHNNVPVAAVFPPELKIPAAKPNDSGWYTCRIANIDGYDTIEYFVEVIEPANIKIGPVRVVATENMIVPFACAVTGVPGPEVTWYMSTSPGGIPFEIDYDDPAFNFRIDSDNQLEVRANQRTDKNVFFCSVSNGATMVNSSEAELSVIPPPPPKTQGNNDPNPPIEPLITLGPGQSRMITCITNPPPGRNITWKVNGKTRPDLANSEAIRVDNERGVHCCEVINTSNQQIVRSQCTYVLPAQPPQLKINVEELSVEVGQSLGIQCQAMGGRPASLLSWVNEEEEEIFEDFSFTQSIFLVEEVKPSDSIEVFCQAENDIYERISQQSVLLNVIDPLTSGLSRDGPNILSNPGAEEGNSPWQFERRPPNDARIEFRNNENVFSLQYPPDISEQDIPSIEQTFDIEGNEQITGLRLSARMRVAMPSTSNGIILPEVVVDFEGNVYELAWPSEMTEFNAWHWVSRDISITPSSASRQGEVILTLGDRGATNVGGEVYLDDISIVPLMSPIVSDPLLIIVGATMGAVGLVIIVAILVIVFICCFCGCCFCCNRGNATKMRKDSLRMRLPKKSTHHYVPDPTKNTRAPPLGDEGQYTSLEERSEAIYTKPDDTYETVTTPGEEYEDMSGDKSIKKEEYYYIQAPASVPSNSHSSSMASISGQPPRSSINSDKVKQVSLAMNDSSYVQLMDGPPLPARNRSGSDEPKTSVPPSEGTKDPVEGTYDQPETVIPMTKEEENDETTEYYETMDIN